MLCITEQIQTDVIEATYSVLIILVCQIQPFKTDNQKYKHGHYATVCMHGCYM